MAVMDKIQFLTMISAGILFIVSLIATELYWKAYCQMKKTRIIGSLALLLLSISIKFLFVIVAFMLVWTESLDLTAFNAMNFVPNLLMILALMYFVHSSISSNGQAKEVLAKVDDKDIRKINDS